MVFQQTKTDFPENVGFYERKTIDQTKKYMFCSPQARKKSVLNRCGFTSIFRFAGLLLIGRLCKTK